MGYRSLAGIAMVAALTAAGAARAQTGWDFRRLDDISFWDAAGLKRDGDKVSYQELRVIKDFHSYPGGAMRVDHIALLTGYQVSCASRTRIATSGIAVYDKQGRLTQPAGPAGKAKGVPLRRDDPMSAVIDRACSDDTSAQAAGLTSIRAAIADVAKRDE